MNSRKRMVKLDEIKKARDTLDAAAVPMPTYFIFPDKDGNQCVICYLDPEQSEPDHETAIEKLREFLQ